jgi:molybdopterin molybdotransferase
MLSLEEARSQVLATVPVLRGEVVPLPSAAGRILRQAVCARLDLPPFDNSAMDGYGARSEDLAEASPETPVSLRCIATVAAGDAYSGKVVKGTCVRLFTGSAVPRGADAVTRQELVGSDRLHPERITFRQPAAPGQDIRRRGEDVRRGQLLLAIGDLLTSTRLGLLAAAGHAKAKVGLRPRVSLLATGSELREPGQPLSRSQIYESNRMALAALTAKAGGEPVALPLVRDNVASLKQALLAAFAESDAVVASGGVSVGEFDLVKQAFEGVGGKLVFWRVAIKPGRPVAFGQWQGKPFFGLPGNPVSACVAFLLLVYPALRRMQGARDCQLPRQPGILAEPFVNHSKRAYLVSVCVQNGQVRLAGAQGSHILSSLARADGIVEIPPQTVWPAGTEVQVVRWD